MKFQDFMTKHASKNKSLITHTRIPDKARNIYPGAFHIPREELATFYELYHAHVFDRSNVEHLTELQGEHGPLAIDLDFRYMTPERKYDGNHIVRFIDAVSEELDTMFTLDEPVFVYVFEKPDVNTSDPTVIKDGIHMIFGVDLDRTAKELLRKHLLLKMSVWDDLAAQLTNNWDSVLDRGVFIGLTGWQLYGSRKPGNQAYKLTRIYECRPDESGMDMVKRHVDRFDLARRFGELSVHSADYPTPLLKPAAQAEYAALKEPPRKVAPPVTEMSSSTNVDEMLEALFAKFHDEPILRSMHEYVMCLPEPYYGANSYEKWIRVGWALKNTDKRLFPSWIKFSSQSPSFEFSMVEKFREMWHSWGKHTDMLTERSILYWARNENPEAYNRIKLNTVDHYIMEIITMPHPTEFDYAQVLHFMYKDLYACVSIRNKMWYQYANQRWTETDTGTDLRNRISGMDGIYGLFQTKLRVHEDQLKTLDSATQPEQFDICRKKIVRISAIATDLKRTDKKNNIMREACDLFYIKDFLSLLDSKNHLLCFTNGVIDFQCPELFRQGSPEDYTSKCTNIPYVPLGPDSADVEKEIHAFMAQLFPVEELRAYMWAHAASTLWGKNSNQTFNIYTGAGRNGKSKFVELMSAALGEYKATVPITLITQKRTSIGGTSSEIVQLMGVRYAVMQEPSIGDRINEGIMKELTGGDPIQGRALFKDSVTFVPQFKLVCCTNNELGIESTDDGTWRRIRYVEFKSHFTENPVSTDPHKPYQFPVDKNIDAKFNTWKTVFMSMLVAHATQSRGDVVDCPMVLAKSEEYRQDQDNFAEFIKTCVREEPGGLLRQSDVYEHFTMWWKEQYGKDSKPPRGKDIAKNMCKRFGPKVDYNGAKSAWMGVTLVSNEAEPEGL